MAKQTPRSTRRPSARTAKRAADLRAFNEAEQVRAAEVAPPPEEPVMEIPPVVVPPEATDPEPIVVTEGDLATAAHRINGFFAVITRGEERLNDSQLAVALELATAKRMCADAKLNFRRWSEQHLDEKRGWQMIRKLAAVGAAPNPQLALDEYRESGRKRTAAYSRRLQAAATRAAIAAPANDATPATRTLSPIVARLAPQQVPDEPAMSAPIEADHTAAREIMSSIRALPVDDIRTVATSALNSIPRDQARIAVEEVFGPGSLAA